MLRDGLEAWERAGLPTVAIDPDERAGAAPGRPASEGLAASGASHTYAFLPGLVERYAGQQALPLRRELTVLFVDIAGSTPLVVGLPPEEALALVQRFMGVVTDAALAYCGDVKDYEGDGALLYFESVLEAAQAALAIREALARQPQGQGPVLRARQSLDVGDVVIGVIGTPLRRSVALIGPSINLAARLLKQIPPGGIVATEAVVERLRQQGPEIARRFRLFAERLALEGFEREVVTAYSLP